jgi:hypothetical protein
MAAELDTPVAVEPQAAELQVTVVEPTLVDHQQAPSAYDSLNADQK